MLRPLTLIAAGLVIALSVPLQAHAQAKGANKRIYCWDEGGKRVCGDALPAEAAGSARQEISTRTGLITREVDRALTAEEQAAAEAQAALEAQQKLDQAERTRRAMAMVASYPSVEGVKKAYEQRIEMARIAKASTEEGIKQNRPQLVRLLQAAGDIELAGNKVPPKQVENIMKVRAGIMALRRQAQAQALEIVQIEQERDEAIALYMEFSQPAATAVAAPVPVAPAQ